MIFYCDDEQDVYIGVYAVESTEEKIIKKVSKIIGLDFEKTSSVPDDIESISIDLDFEIDTIVVCSKDYNEDFAELSDKGLGIYIIP
jgi:hypothetical protein